MIVRVAEYDAKYHRWKRVTQQDAHRLDQAGEEVIEVPSAPRVMKDTGFVAGSTHYFAPPEALVRHQIPEIAK